MMLLSMMMVLAAQADAGAAPESAEPMEPATFPGSWATNDDYPARAMREEREGTTGFQLTIGADGLPSACDIISSSGHGDLDATTCRLVMERARFKPGRDAKGKPTGGTYSNRIRWQIPEGGGMFALGTPGFAIDEGGEGWPRPPRPDMAMNGILPADHYPAAARDAREEGIVRMAVDVDVAGRVTGCSVTESSLSTSLDTASCALMRDKGKFEPALDGAGKPAKGMAPVKFTWLLPPAEAAGDGAIVPPSVRKFPMSDPGSMVMTLVVGADGTVSGCRFESTGTMAPPPEDGSPCEMFQGPRQFIPFVDADGKPGARRVTMRSELLIEDAPAAAPSK
ncbi:energy transducer TonB [Sphingopyxis sp.]|uniref:energy transducer TonB n=1 Tax=Sphingopyxis sp. TaxID=1908224 RepID=UPI002ED98176